MAEQRQSGLGQVKVKGTQDGLMLQLPSDVPLSLLLGQVRAQIDGSPDFFRRAEIIIDYASRVPNVEEIVALRAMLSERGVALRTVVAGSAAHRDLLRSWGYHPLRVVSAHDSNAAPDSQPFAADGERAAQYVRRTLRSGASVQSNGDILILGDVNAGAEVLAGGDVIVWGAIRGTVHAGITGDFSSIICALRLTPTQLRIASIFARPPDQREAHLDGPVIARVQNGEIIVESWRPDRRTGL